MDHSAQDADPGDRRLIFTDPLPLGGRLVMIVAAGGLLVAPWKVFVAHEVGSPWATLLADGAILVALGLVAAALLVRSLVCEVDLGRRRVSGGVAGFVGLGLRRSHAFDDVAQIGATRHANGDRPATWTVWIAPRRGHHLRVATFPDRERAEALRDDLRAMVGLGS